MTRVWEMFVDLVLSLRDMIMSAYDSLVLTFRKDTVRPAAAKPVHIPGVAPQIPSGRRVYAVGDVHGRADLLQRLIAELREDAKQGEYEGRPILIFLGDYVDRGFQSKEVLSTLISPALSEFETYFLKGNHEAAMLQFLKDPSIGPRWAEYGGVETLVSYGVQPPRVRTSMDEWARASQALNAALPQQHRHFLENLDISVRIGDYIFVHAGLRPGVSLDMQSEHDMLWIREEFLEDRKHLGAVVVHGHTPSQAPYRDSRRIGIDTGAYLSGRLTAARLQADTVEFLTTGRRIEAVAS
ncbi:MAG: metallophosphoesterase family protein [Hyphomonadaceae bacterium]